MITNTANACSVWIEMNHFEHYGHEVMVIFFFTISKFLFYIIGPLDQRTF